MIKPTVGRVAWFWDEKPITSFQQPRAAIITTVWGDRCVNLAIFEENGVPRSHPPTSVTLVQEEDEIPEIGAYCQWMPYQVGQAKRQSTDFPSKPSGREALSLTANRPPEIS